MASANPAQWTLFDKVAFGGLGYGSFCLPTNFFIIIITCLFPPMGQMLNIIGDSITPNPPFFTWNVIKLLFTPDSISSIIYSFILTSFFYIPGLVFVLSNIANADIHPKH